MDVGTSEDGAFWLAFLRSLSARGLGGVELVVSDAHQGLRGAIAAVFGGASWQRCRTLAQIASPSVCYNTKVNRVVKVLDFVKSGGPVLTVGRTVFEMWLGRCKPSAQVRRRRP